MCIPGLSTSISFFSFLKEGFVLNKLSIPSISTECWVCGWPISCHISSLVFGSPSALMIDQYLMIPDAI